ncbi:MAG: Txe/YoeB family addiction module toxin [Tannerellaceae bacterium]|nr:Txe/YoeB family addiction module toxin [Tannerellaceae bacterium]
MPKKSDTVAYRKLQQLLLELMEHPYTGTGKPKPMKYEFSGCYSRRITKKHRLVYSVDDDKVIVLVLSVSGHYNDK